MLGGWFYVNQLLCERDKLQNQSYKAEALSLKKRLESLIEAKQKSTIAIALSIANDKELARRIENLDIPDDYYKELISRFNEHTLYKNIWIQITDKDLNSIYKSWDKNHGESKKHFRDDLVKAMQDKKPVLSINSGLYDLSIRAIVPLFNGEKSIGALEVISHFNSISKVLKEFNTDSVVVLNKDRNKFLEHPFTRTFVNGYYVANLDAPTRFTELLSKDGIEKYFNSHYKVKNGYLIVSHEIKEMDGKTIGHYIMFKSIVSLSDKNIDFFMLKWFAVSAVGVLILSMIIGNIVYYRNERQRNYYKNIIDSSSNIVLVLSKDAMLDVNKIFFKYFKKYNTLEEFKLEHSSIADFFCEEEGYVHQKMSNGSWLDHLIKKPLNNQVKMLIDGEIYYFTVNISMISPEDGHYSAIFSDITKEKVYQEELEHTNITDPLTKAKNRYYYNEQIKKESANANRYFYPLSLIIFDVDHFKKINDEYGHDIGDAVLVEYSGMIHSLLREGDMFCRIGGEEFAIILPHTGIAYAYKLAEKIRMHVQEHKKVVPITMSFGVTEYKRGEDIEMTFKRADNALYEAKHGGRNKAVLK